MAKYSFATNEENGGRQSIFHQQGMDQNQFQTNDFQKDHEGFQPPPPDPPSDDGDPIDTPADGSMMADILFFLVCGGLVALTLNRKNIRERVF